MEMLQYAGPAIRDLGIYNIDEWGGGFNNVYKEIFSALFNEERKLHDYLIPIVLELKKFSVCGPDKKMLAATIARVGAMYAFANISTERNLPK